MKFSNRKEWMSRSRMRALLCGGLSALLSVGFLAAAPSEAMAQAGPGLEDAQEEQPYDAQTMERLEDQVLEYDEIDKMIHLYNPNMINAWSSIQDSIDSIERSVTELKSAQKAMEMAKDDAKDEKNPTGAAIYGAQASALKGIADSMRDGLDTIEKPSTTAQLRQAEYQVTKYGQNAVIGYSSLLAQKATVQQMQAMYQAKLNLTVNQRNEGMATEADVLAAQAELLSASSTLLTIQQSEDQVRRNILLMVGQPSSSTMTIQPVSGVMERYAQVENTDLNADTAKAIGNNPDLISMRHAAGGSTVDMNKRFRSVEDGEQKLRVEMERLRRDIDTKKMAYDAALTGDEIARMSFESAQRKKDQGLVGNTEYQGLQLSAIQKQSEKEAAEIALFQAIEDYEWAVRGIILDSGWKD